MDWWGLCNIVEVAFYKSISFNNYRTFGYHNSFHQYYLYKVHYPQPVPYPMPPNEGTQVVFFYILFLPLQLFKKKILGSDLDLWFFYHIENKALFDNHESRSGPKIFFLIVVNGIALNTKWPKGAFPKSRSFIVLSFWMVITKGR